MEAPAQDELSCGPNSTLTFKRNSTTTQPKSLDKWVITATLNADGEGGMNGIGNQLEQDDASYEDAPGPIVDIAYECEDCWVQRDTVCNGGGMVGEAITSDVVGHERLVDRGDGYAHE